MAGTVIEYSKRSYTFSSLGLGASQTIIVEPYLNLGEWTEATLLVRLFSRTVGAGASIVVEVRRTSPTQEEPSKRFVPATATLSTVTIDSLTGAAPLLLRGILPATFGGMVEISVKGTQATGALQTIIADVAVGVSLKRRRGSARSSRPSVVTAPSPRRGCGK